MIARPTASAPAAMISVLKSRRNAPRIGPPRPFETTNAATVASAIVETTAMRRPAMIAGTASGSSTRRSVWFRVRPIPRAASSTSGGTARRPASVFRKRISTV